MGTYRTLCVHGGDDEAEPPRGTVRAHLALRQYAQWDGGGELGTARLWTRMDSNFRSSITLINVPVSPHTNFLANFNFKLNPRATTREVRLVVGEWEEDLRSQK